MKILNTSVAILALLVGAALPACSCGDDDGSAGPDASDIDAPEADADPNAFPALGTQIDRAGRAAITTALIKSILYTDDADRNGAKDAYNADADTANWATNRDQIAAHLGVLDGLDGACGTQFAYDDLAPAGESYFPLATVLANDRLLVNVTTTVCDDGYLAVETNVAGNCGGRTPTQDVIDVSYGVLAGSQPGDGRPVVDNIPPDGAGIHNIVTFPFLGTPLSN